MAFDQISERQLNRALLARQGLIERLATNPAEAVERIGAVQAQYFPALTVALWSRVEDIRPDTVPEELTAGRLVLGTLLRRTLHLVTPANHRLYAAATAAAGGDDWRRTRGEPTVEARTLRSDFVTFAAGAPRTPQEVLDWIEEWVTRHPGAIDEAELEAQRKSKWRPFRTSVRLIRFPADGVWGARVPQAVRSAPSPAPELSPEEALRGTVRAHLAAFGPAGADDVAQWIGWPVTPVKAHLHRIADELVVFQDDSGRRLYDLPDAPRPESESDVPVRLLPWFDSTLLAYARGHRSRILPPDYQDAVYEKANLQLRPTFLVDGRVAGTWSLETKRRTALLTLTPLEPLSKRTLSQLEEEAERLLKVCSGDAAHRDIRVSRV